MSKCQVMAHGQAVLSMDAMSKIALNTCQTYLNHIIKQLLTLISVDMK